MATPGAENDGREKPLAGPLRKSVRKRKVPVQEVMEDATVNVGNQNNGREASCAGGSEGLVNDAELSAG
jgi:hypothetical protein